LDDQEVLYDSLQGSLLKTPSFLIAMEQTFQHGIAELVSSGC